MAHLATTTFIPKAENVILPGPPGVRKTHLAIGARDQVRPRRLPGAIRHRDQLGEPPADRSRSRAARGRTETPPPLAPTDHRRDRLSALRRGRREPVLPTRRIPLRARLHPRHVEYAVWAMGWDLQRRHRRRRDDRPAHLPRRGPHPLRRLVPHQGPTRAPQNPREPRGPVMSCLRTSMTILCQDIGITSWIVDGDTSPSSVRDESQRTCCPSSLSPCCWHGPRT